MPAVFGLNARKSRTQSRNTVQPNPSTASAATVPGASRANIVEMRWLIPIAGTALAAGETLTAWWGIAIIAALALVHLMDALAGANRQARTVHGEPDVYGAVQFLVITLPIVAGLFVGNAIADAVGAAIGSVAAGLIGSVAFTLIYATTERQIIEREG